MLVPVMPSVTSGQGGLPDLPDEIEDIVEDPAEEIPDEGDVAAETDSLIASVPSIYSCVMRSDGKCGNQKVTNTAAPSGTDVDVNGNGDGAGADEAPDVRVSYDPANITNSFSVTVALKNSSDVVRARVELVVAPPPGVPTPREFVFLGADGTLTGLPTSTTAQIDYSAQGGDELSITPTVDGVKGRTYGVRAGAFETSAIEPRPRGLQGGFFYEGTPSRPPPESPTVTVNPDAGTASFRAGTGGAGTNMILVTEDVDGGTTLSADLTRIPQEMTLTRTGTDDFPGVTYTSTGSNPAKLGRLEVKSGHTGPVPITRCGELLSSTGQPDLGVTAVDVPNRVEVESLDNDDSPCNEPDPNEAKITYSASDVLPQLTATVDSNGDEADLLEVRAQRVPSEVQLTATKGNDSRVSYVSNGSLRTLSAVIRAPDAFSVVTASGSNARPFPSRASFTTETVPGDCDQVKARFSANRSVNAANILTRSTCGGQEREIAAFPRRFQIVRLETTPDSVKSTMLPPIQSLKLRLRKGTPFITSGFPEVGRERDLLRFTRIRFEDRDTPNQVAIDSRGAEGQELKAQLASLRNLEFRTAPDTFLRVRGGGGGRFAFEGKVPAAQGAPDPDCGLPGVETPAATISGSVDSLPTDLTIDEAECGASYTYDAADPIGQLRVTARTTPAAGEELRRLPNTPEEALNRLPLRLDLIADDVPRKLTLHTDRTENGKVGLEAVGLAELGQIRLAVTDGGAGFNLPADRNAFRFHLREDELRDGNPGWLNIAARVHDLKSATAVPGEGNVKTRVLRGNPRELVVQDSDLQLGDEDNPVMRFNGNMPDPPKRMNVTVVPPADNAPLMRLKLDNSADVPRLNFSFGFDGTLLARADVRDITAKTDVCLDVGNWECGPTITRTTEIDRLGGTPLGVIKTLGNFTFATDIRSQRIRRPLRVARLRVCFGDDVDPVGATNCLFTGVGLRVAATNFRATDFKLGVGAGDQVNDQCENLVAFGLDGQPVSVEKVVLDVTSPAKPACDRPPEDKHIEATAPHLAADRRLNGNGFVAIGPVPTFFGPTYTQGDIVECGDLKIEALLGILIEVTGEVTQGECR